MKMSRQLGGIFPREFIDSLSFDRTVTISVDQVIVHAIRWLK